MIAFKSIGLFEMILRFWPPYKRQQDVLTKKMLRYLVEHPEAPCMIDDTYIPNGYGKEKKNDYNE